ncbi:MAG: carbon storage regulator CsrA [Campylobacterales bacterium]
MLILSRKENESIHIGKNIKIKVVSIEKGSVKLGLEAPDDVLILRDELAQAVQDENIRASNIPTSSEKLKSLFDRLKKDK